MTGGLSKLHFKAPHPDLALHCAYQRALDAPAWNLETESSDLYAGNWQLVWRKLSRRRKRRGQIVNEVIHVTIDIGLLLCPPGVWSAMKSGPSDFLLSCVFKVHKDCVLRVDSFTSKMFYFNDFHHSICSIIESYKIRH